MNFMKSKNNSKWLLFVLAVVGMSGMAADKDSGFMTLFPQDGIPKGWVVRRWDEVSKAAEKEAVWKVENGVLQGSEPRGTWLLSEKEYGDFVLEFEWK